MTRPEYVEFLGDALGNATRVSRKEGRNRREYRSAKFGSWEYSQRLNAEVAEAGRQAGLEFQHERAWSGLRIPSMRTA
jgi:predicted DsbA family dithiol-disulfide isomerase